MNGPRTTPTNVSIRMGRFRKNSDGSVSALRQRMRISPSDVLISAQSRNVPSCPTLNLGNPAHIMSLDEGKRTTTSVIAGAPFKVSCTAMIASCQYGLCSLRFGL